MGVIDRYGRDKNGNVTVDGNVPSTKRRGLGNDADLDALLRKGWQIGVEQREVVDDVQEDLSDGGHLGNNRIDVIDPSKNKYVYPGKDYVYPSDETKESDTIREEMLDPSNGGHIVVGLKEDGLEGRAWPTPPQEENDIPITTRIKNWFKKLK